MNYYSLGCMDVIYFLRQMKSESVDCIITDPAYESLENHRAKGTTTRLSHSKSSSNDWFAIFPNSRFEELFAEFYRVLAKNAHIYVYVDLETMFVVKPIAEAAGFTFWNQIVWDKVAMGMGYHYRRRKESVLFFEKGKRRLNSLGVADVLDIDENRGVDTILAKRIRNAYPTEKPVAVSRVLLNQSTLPGELVLDPFMGSGSVGVAALLGGRNFIGCDVSHRALKLTWNRLYGLGGTESFEVGADLTIPGYTPAFEHRPLPWVESDGPPPPSPSLDEVYASNGGNGGNEPERTAVPVEDYDAEDIRWVRAAHKGE